MMVVHIAEPEVRPLKISDPNTAHRSRSERDATGREGRAQAVDSGLGGLKLLPTRLRGTRRCVS